MTVLGIGTDLVELERLQSILDRDAAEAFRRKVFTSSEIKYCENYARPVERYGARFAAKEAFIKAFGTGDVSLKDIGVDREDGGKPVYHLPEALWARLRQRGIQRIHLTLSHTRRLATAVAIFEGN